MSRTTSKKIKNLKKKYRLTKISDVSKDNNALLEYINEKYKPINREHLLFLVEYLGSTNAALAYQNVYPNVKIKSAACLASALLKRYKFDRAEILEIAGHGIQSLIDTLDFLKKHDQKAYADIWIRLHSNNVAVLQQNNFQQNIIINFSSNPENVVRD